MDHCRSYKSDEAAGGAAMAEASHADESMQVDAAPAGGVSVETLFGRAVATSETSSAVGGWRVEEVGPSLDLVLRRAHLPAFDLWKRACHTPKPVRVRYGYAACVTLVVAIQVRNCNALLNVRACVQMQEKRQRMEGRSVSQKNVRFDAHGTQLGRLHLPRQDLSGLALHRPRALRHPAAKRARAGGDRSLTRETAETDVPAPEPQ